MQYSEQDVQKLLQEQRQRMAERIETLKNNPNFLGTGGGKPFPDELDAYNQALQDALNIVLGEDMSGFEGTNEALDKLSIRR